MEGSMKKILLNRYFVLFVSIATFLFNAAPPNVLAMPSESVTVFDRESARQAQIEKIMSVLEKPEARAHLAAMGMNKAEMRDSLSKLDDAQLARVSDQADQVKAAGDAGLGIVIGILLIILLVVVIMRLV
jgi:hypothetical protein